MRRAPTRPLTRVLRCPKGSQWSIAPPDGFVIALPPGWQNFDLTSADVDAIVQAATEANPNLQGDVGNAVKKLVDEGGLLYASDTSNPGKFLTNVNLIKVTGVTSGLGLLQQQAQTQLHCRGRDERVEHAGLTAGRRRGAHHLHRAGDAVGRHQGRDRGAAGLLPDPSGTCTC